MNKIELYTKKMNDYLEVNNKSMANKYKKLIREEENKSLDRDYYENRIKSLVRFIRAKGLYEELQIYLNDEE